MGTNTNISSRFLNNDTTRIGRSNLSVPNEKLLPVLKNNNNNNINGTTLSSLQENSQQLIVNSQASAVLSAMGETRMNSMVIQPKSILELDSSQYIEEKDAPQ